MTESEFIDAIKSHAGIIGKVTYLYLDDPEERKDMAQEIQLQAWRSIKNFRGDSQFSTWLYRVALNTVFSFNRKKKLDLESMDQKDIQEEAREISEQAENLLRAIKTLSDVDKSIISLHLEDFDNGEIADITGLTKNNVGVKLHRIKDQLKQKLNPVKHG